MAPREVELEQRLRKMEEMNQKLIERFEAMAEQNKALVTKVDALTKGASATPPDAGDGNGDGMDAPDAPAGAGGNPARPEVGGSNADDDQPSDIRTDEPEPKPTGAPTKSIFTEGFKWETEDGEFQLHFHNETQLDTRIYGRSNADPVNQVNFTTPRMRLIFNGRMTKPIEYNVSINKGLGSLDLLDAYINFNYDSRFQVRIGRYRVPFTYDWYAIANQFNTTPERSIFAINYGFNRNYAVMGHGELFDDRVDYAVAAANGPRNSYFDTNGHKDLLAYLNVRPFYQVKSLAFLKHLNVGGSVAYGIEDQEPLPVLFRTSANATDSAGTVEAVPSFLELNDNVVERGRREMWEIHGAYYYKGLSLFGAYDRGFNDYGILNEKTQVHLPTHGFHVSTGYFLTGEHVERRTFVEPLRPFDLRKGKRGPGAIELQARYSEFGVGKEVFTGHLADGNNWTNNVYAVDAGVNWYLNKYVKIYFDWQHSVFGNPVLYRPGARQNTSDLYWLRFQVYF